MSKQSNTTKLSYNHLSVIERGKFEVLFKQGKSQSEIARELARNRFTISPELKRGTATQMKIKHKKTSHSSASPISSKCCLWVREIRDLGSNFRHETPKVFAAVLLLL